MRNNILCVFILFLTSLSLKSQSINCNSLIDDFFYIKLEIRDNKNYPVIMTGLTKTLDFKNLSKKNSSSLLKDFFSKAEYLPDLYFIYDEFIIKCLGEIDGKAFINKNPNQGNYIISRLNNKSKTILFYLEDGKSVYISVTKIKGEFWKFNIDKDRFNSYEMKVNEIKSGLIPYKILCLKKVKKKDILID